MNKKFFAALASATMAFTASGSIAVFADDFVEEKTPVVDSNVVKPQEELTVKWDKEHFGDLVTIVKQTETFKGLDVTLKENEEVKTADLEKVKGIELQKAFTGEVKGLEYFPELTSFDDTAVNNGTNVTNTTFNFSANTKLETLKVTKAKGLEEIVLPEALVNEDKEEVYSLKTLVLENTNVASLDLSNYYNLNDVTVKDSKLGKLDLSALTLNNVTVSGNYNLAEVVLNNGKQGRPTEFATLDLSNNSLETVNLDYVTVTGTTFSLDGNHIGALDLSKTTVPAGATLGTQTFYVSENFGTVTLPETFENFNVERVTEPTDKKEYDKETGVLTLKEGKTTYKYDTKVTGANTTTLTVEISKANPMNRLYNPNSGEHFYTADLKEKEALVNLGWNDEGYGWVAAPTKGATEEQAVYRLYNPNAGDHHYTMDENEVKTLKAYGWKDEGTGWYSANTGDKVAVYRQYNPYANGAGSHNYTPNKAENDYLVSLGWTPEGTAWYGLK